MSSRTLTLISSGLLTAGAAFLTLAPSAQAIPDPGQPPPTRSGGEVVVREIEVATPVDDDGFEPAQAGLGVLVGALAGAGVLAGARRIRTAPLTG